MAEEISHLRDVGVVGYPASVSSAAAPAAAPAAAAAAEASSASTATGKKEKSGKKGGDAKSAAAAAPVPTGPFVEKSKEELDKMSKDERRLYHQAKLAHDKAAGGGAGPDGAKGKQVLTKEERRKIQEAQRKVKEDKANAGKEGDELFAELKLQGLSEDQARAVMQEMISGEAVEEDAEDDDGPDDLLGSVRSWMQDQPEKVPEDVLRDFNMKVRFQGHVDSTPPDHLNTMLQILAGQACAALDLSAKSLKPNAISDALQPLLERWAPLLRALLSKIDDILDKVNAVIGGITASVAATGAPEANQETALVGCLMAVREIDDLVEEEDLIIGCKAIETRGKVMDKFIEFLESCLESDEDDDEDDE